MGPWRFSLACVTALYSLTISAGPTPQATLGLHVANRSDPLIPVCEACHGPGSQHAAYPQAEGLIIGYTKNSGTTIEIQTKTCLTCHAGGPRDHWVNSVHQLNGLSCSDRHNPMAKCI